MFINISFCKNKGMFPHIAFKEVEKMQIYKTFSLNLESEDVYKKAQAFVKLQGSTMSKIVSDIIKKLNDDFEKKVKGA